MHDKTHSQNLFKNPSLKTYRNPVYICVLHATGYFDDYSGSVWNNLVAYHRALY